MVKVEMEATELRNGNIEKISLVTHGAIRQPFKILKMREIEAGSKTGGFRNTINKIFSQTDEQSRIAAVFVRKDVARKLIPIIKANGFRVEKEHAELVGDVLVLKQEGFDPDAELPVIALNSDMAVQLGSVSKYFDPYPSSASFEENVAAGSFWPGMHSAMDSLHETIWHILNESDTPEEAATDVAKQVKAFSTHLNSLIAELPTAVFKMEQEMLTKEFEGANVSSTDKKITLDEEQSMSGTAVLKEAAAGDLDGLLDEAPAADAALAAADAAANAAGQNIAKTDVVQFFKGNEQLTKESFAALADEDEVIVKQEGEADRTMTKADIVKGGDEGAPKSGGSPGSPVVNNTSDTGAVSLDEGGVPAGFRKEERVVKSLDDKGNIIEKFAEFLINEENGEEIFVKFIDALSGSAPQGDQKTDYTDAENKLFAAMGVMVKSLTGISEKLDTVTTRIDAVEKTADTAKETAEGTVILPSAAEDLGNAIATLSGQHGIKKAAAPAAEGEVVDIFKGLLPQVEGNAA